MTFDSWSQQIIIVSVPPEPQAGRQIAVMTSLIAEKSREDMILDLSRADTLRHSTLRGLMQMQRVLKRNGRKLALCNVSPAVFSTISSCNLHKTLCIADASAVVLSPPMTAGGEGLLILASSSGYRARERRKCVRIHIADSLRIDVRISTEATGTCTEDSLPAILVDISENGAQVAVESEDFRPLKTGSTVNLELADSCLAENPTLKARISEILPAADCSGVCLGLQFEPDAGPALNRAIRQLCDCQVRYYQTTAPISVG